jgi:hypothetical protein
VDECKGCSDDWVVNADVCKSTDSATYIAGYRGMVNGFVDQHSNSGEDEIISSDDGAFYGIWCSQEGPLWVAGVKRNSEGEKGLVVRQKDGEWLFEEIAAQPLYDIWAVNSEDVVSVGGESTIVHYKNGEWKLENIEEGNDAKAPLVELDGVWGNAPDLYFAVGDGGLIIKYDGQSWREEESGVTSDLSAVWGTAENNVFAVGGSDSSSDRHYVVLHYDGDKWSKIARGTDADLIGVHGDEQGNAYAVGGERDEDGVHSFLLKCDSQSCERIPTEVQEFLWSIWVTPDHRYYAVGPDDTFIEGTL